MSEYSPRDVLWAVNDVLQTKVDIVQPTQIGARRMKVRVDDLEKLIRIQAAIYALDDPKMIQAIQDEAYNRILVAKKTNEMTGGNLKPWQSGQR